VALQEIFYSKWELLAPGIVDIRLNYYSHTVKKVKGDGNCLTNCIQEILRKFKNEDYSIGDLKSLLTLYVLSHLVGKSLDDFQGAGRTTPELVDQFVSVNGKTIVKTTWKFIISQLDAPDGSKKKKPLQEEIDKIAKTRDPPTLKVLYESVLKKHICVDGFYLTSESLKYYCEAFSLNILVWYPDIDNPGSYLKRDEYGVEHDPVFMVRQIDFGLEVNEKNLRGQAPTLSWNRTKEEMRMPVKQPHFDVLYLKPDGVFDLCNKDDGLLGTASLTDNFQLILSSSSSRKHGERGEMCIFSFLFCFFL
jgi:hypothetical protein